MNVDSGLLRKCGLANLSQAQQESLLAAWVEALQLLVGEILSEGLSEAQMEEFEEIIDFEATEEGKALADAAAQDWLSINVPHYKVVARAQQEEMLRELWDAAPRICESRGITLIATERLPVDDFVAEVLGDE